MMAPEPKKKEGKRRAHQRGTTITKRRQIIIGWRRPSGLGPAPGCPLSPSRNGATIVRRTAAGMHHNHFVAVGHPLRVPPTRHPKRTTAATHRNGRRREHSGAGWRGVRPYHHHPLLCGCCSLQGTTLFSPRCPATGTKHPLCRVFFAHHEAS